MWKSGKKVKSTLILTMFSTIVDLAGLSGIAAILRFPLPDLEEEVANEALEEDDGDDDDEMEFA